MKMIFDADEMVTVREGLCGTWKIRKTEIADFLISEQQEEEKLAKREYHLFGEKTLERAVILSNLTNVISIEITNNLIELKPIGIRMRVDETIIDFLESRAE